MDLSFITNTVGKLFASETFLHALQVWLFKDLTAPTFFCLLFIMAGLWWFRIQTINQLEEKRHKREMEKIRIIRERSNYE